MQLTYSINICYAYFSFLCTTLFCIFNFLVIRKITGKSTNYEKTINPRNKKNERYKDKRIKKCLGHVMNLYQQLKKLAALKKLILTVRQWKLFTLVEYSTGSEKTVMVGCRGKGGRGRWWGTGGRSPVPGTT